MHKMSISKKKTNKRAINKKAKHKKKSHNESIVIEFNLSKAVIAFIIIGVLIGTMTTVKVVTTIMATKKSETLANEEQNATDNVTWVESTELDENGKAIKVPVPKGYTASKIDGETTVRGGFVIYEGDIDWSTIIIEPDTENIANETTTSSNEGATTNEVSNLGKEKSAENVTIASNEISEDNTVNLEDVIEKEEPMVLNDTDEDTTIMNNTVEDVNVVSDETTTNVTIENTTTDNVVTTAEETTEDETAAKTAEEQTGINVFNLQKTANQYVWIPVDDISRIYGVDSNGKLWGKLYQFPTSATGSRTAYNWTETNGIMKITNITDYKEPDVTIKNDEDWYVQFKIYGKTRFELLSKDLEQNFYETIKSIKKYGGFYIGRYETGMETEKAIEPVVRKMNMNAHIKGDTWYEMYQKSKVLKGTNENVMTSMISSSLWDETLEWLVESGATIQNGTTLTYPLIGSDSVTWGNYINATFNYIPSESETPEATAIKAINTDITIPTGSSDYTKVNNIYDLAGNMAEWTLIVQGENRAISGGASNWQGSSGRVSRWKSDLPYKAYSNVSSRAVLLIK